MQLSVSPLTTQSRGPTATTLGSHPGNDGSIPSGTTDYAQIRQPAERLGSDPRVCGFDSCSGYLKKYVLVEQRSARLPVTQEIVGSNPIGDAQHGMVRQLAERRISNVRGCGFDSLPCYSKNNMRRLGIGEPKWL